MLFNTLWREEVVTIYNCLNKLILHVAFKEDKQARG